MDFPASNQDFLRSVLEQGRLYLYSLTIDVEVIRGFKAGLYLNAWFEHIIELDRALCSPLETIPVQTVLAVKDKSLPMLKAFLVKERLRVADEVEQLKAMTSNANVLNELDARLKPYDEMMALPWFNKTKAVVLPRLSDFLTIERIEAGAQKKQAEAPRLFDEKFHILQAPTLLYQDLASYRQKCSFRDAPVGIAFIDIDNFKGFNSAIGETSVDRYVLPPFMRLLESSVYAHGYAYRFDGDEYAVALPNSDHASTLKVLAEFRKKLVILAGRDRRSAIGKA